MKRLALFFIILFSSVAFLQAQSLSLKNAFPQLNFHQPLFLTSSRDHSDRIFVVSQDGFIHVFPNDSSVTTTGLFLDVSNRLSSSNGEEGLLGLAFPPDFQTSRVFYVNYTAPSANSPSGMKVVVARYAMSGSDPNKADPATEKRVLEIEEPAHNHNGGMLAFGPDSMLYIGVGDGGSANDPWNNGQSLTTLLGKILRIDVRGDSGYAIPSDNPFVARTDSTRKEIWAYGLRNPWRFSFDSATGQLWAGDVGQDTREEIDIITRGGNYGWKIMEGMICRPGGGDGCDQTGLIKPIADFGRTVASSITGGYVYRGSKLPQLRGAYIFGDFGTGNIFLIGYKGGTVIADSILFRNTSLSISSFGVDEQNELYVLGYSTGKILKLVGPNSPQVDTPAVSLSYTLEGNWPNPFNPFTTIKYTVGGTKASGTNGAENGGAQVSLVVYDVLGRQVATLVNERKTPGSYEVRFDGSGLASGVYYYRLTSADFEQTRAMMLVK